MDALWSELHKGDNLLGTSSSFQHQKRRPFDTPTPSFARPVSQFAPLPSPSSQNAHRDLRASLDHAARFGHSFERISILPPEKKNDTGLPDTLRAGIESLSGLSMDDVKVHYNSSKPAQMQALAYTQGTDIHVGPGQEQHLPHEAWHVVQQKQGRVKPTLQAKGVAINDDWGLEREADVNGVRAAIDKERTQSITKPLRSSIQQPKVLQAQWKRHPSKDLWLWGPQINGLTWFSDAKGFMWYKITDQTKIVARSKVNYSAMEGKPLSTEEWDKLEVQHPLWEPELMHQAEALETIKKSDPNSWKSTTVGDKPMHLFDAHGAPVSSKNKAEYIVSEMPQEVLQFYREVAALGLRVPNIYGETRQPGYYVIQWIKNATTAGGAGARELYLQVRQSMYLDVINDRPFNRAKWQHTLEDVNNLLKLKYTSPDLQFMIDGKSGHIFLMDLNPEDNPPRIGAEPDPRLVNLHKFLMECIKMSDTPEQLHKFLKPN